MSEKIASKQEPTWLNKMLAGAALGGTGMFGVLALQDLIGSAYNAVSSPVKIPTSIEVDISPYKKKYKEKKSSENMGCCSFDVPLEDFPEHLEKTAEGETISNALAYMVPGVSAAYLANKLYNNLHKRRNDLEYANKIKEYENLMNKQYQSKYQQPQIKVAEEIEKKYDERYKTANLYIEGVKAGIKKELEYHFGKEATFKNPVEKRANRFTDFTSNTWDALKGIGGSIVELGETIPEIASYYSPVVAGLVPLGFLAGYKLTEFNHPVLGDKNKANELAGITFVDKEKEKELAEKRMLEGDMSKASSLKSHATPVEDESMEKEAYFMNFLIPALVGAGALYGGYKLLEGTEPGPYGIQPQPNLVSQPVVPAPVVPAQIPSAGMMAPQQKRKKGVA